MKLHEYERNYEIEQDHWWFVAVRAMVMRLLALSGKTTDLGTVLDVGCGTGALLDQLRGLSEKLYGADASSEALKYCALRGHKNLLLCDATNTAFPSNSFDVITAIGIIEHIDNDHAFLVEMERLLRPQGVMVLLTSSFPYLWSIHDTANEHKRRYYLRALNKKLNSIGFETIRFSHFNFLLFPAIAVMLLSHRLFYGVESERPMRILPILPKIINRILTKVLLCESMLMGWIRIPWGISMIGVFRKSPCGI